MEKKQNRTVATETRRARSNGLRFSYKAAALREQNEPFFFLPFLVSVPLNSRQTQKIIE